jgi:hypothetical protein
MQTEAQVALASFIIAMVMLITKFAYNAFKSCADGKTEWVIKSPCGKQYNCGCELVTDGSSVVSSTCNWGIDGCCICSRTEHEHQNEILNVV